MANTTITISAGSGDCWCNKPSIGTFDNSGADLKVGGEGSVGDDVQTWIPFVITFKKTIVSATLRLIATGGSVGDPSVRIGCEAADNPAAPVSLADLRARVMTSSFYDVTAGTNSVGATVDFDVTNAVQEVLNRAGFVPNNTLAIYIQDLVSGSAQHRHYAAVEHATYSEPKLLITIPYFLPRSGAVI